MDESFMRTRPVLPLLVSMALPMVISMLVNSLYNIVDSFFVAQISEDAMIALSLVYPIQNLITSIAVGFGVGLNAVIAYHLGAGDKKKADTAATHGLLFSAIHGIIIMIVSILIMPVFLRMFTSNSNVLSLGTQYSTIAFSFSLIIMVGLSFEKMFQAVGRMKVTMISLLCGCICNIILDPILIFGIGIFPKMGIKGAALATGIGQCLNLVIYLVIYVKRPIPVRINRQYAALNKEIDLKLYAVGIPATLNMALPSLLISCLNALLALYSQSYVAILGIYYKLQTFLYLPANGIIQGMRPIIGYNFGAREHKRVKKIYEITLCMCAMIMAIGTLICLIASKQLIGMFTSNSETIMAGQTALRVISAGFIASAVSVASSGALEGLGKGTQSLMISLCRYVIIIIPAAFLLSKIWGPIGVWNAFWIAELLTAMIAFLIYQKSAKSNV
ncbi:MAG: MATE family efflux transporter [Lachnospiraceae bacterium]|nr:MATE family efflux transporter [Lachnospiraceae bacterium]